MAYHCKIMADSVSERGHRLTTFIITLPRIVLAEFNTHRVFSRNSASSRAIPTRKQLKALIEDMFTPAEFGTAVKGMNAGPVLSGDKLAQAIEVWGEAADAQMMYALCLTTSPEYFEREWALWEDEHQDTDLGSFVLDVIDRIDDESHPIHNESLLWTTKGLTNRLLEPFMWHTVIVTATEWDNFFNLRTDKNAQLEIRTAAKLMQEAYAASTPKLLKPGEWHLPFIQEHEMEWARANPELAVKAVVARCARVSYLTHDRQVIDLEADYRTYNQLVTNGHMSPLEHAATPITAEEWLVRRGMIDLARSSTLPEHIRDNLTNMMQFAGNFRGWSQARREMPNERVWLPAA